MFWIRPNSESFADPVKRFILDNREHFVSLKIHPFHSRLAVTNDKYKPYFEFAENYKIPVCIHTAPDQFSKPQFVYEMAKKYPGINFIMVHMNLGGDHNLPIQYMKELDNLYSDSTWVLDQKTIMQAVKICGSRKVFFGTDASISKGGTYIQYKNLMKYLINNLNREDLENIFYKNMERLFLNNNNK